MGLHGLQKGRDLGAGPRSHLAQRVGPQRGRIALIGGIDVDQTPPNRVAKSAVESRVDAPDCGGGQAAPDRWRGQKLRIELVQNWPVQLMQTKVPELGLQMVPDVTPVSGGGRESDRALDGGHPHRREERAESGCFG